MSVRPGGYTERRTREVAAPADVLWGVVCGVGGENGWYAADPGWRLRAGLDRVLGGPGMRTGRPQGEPRRGDTVDFWRVEDVEQWESHRSLRLRAEMRMPGTAWLELGVSETGVSETVVSEPYVCEPGVSELDPSRSVLTQVTEFEPSGPAGHAYWWVEQPAHRLVFAAMVRGLAREAERRGRPAGGVR